MIYTKACSISTNNPFTRTTIMFDMLSFANIIYVNNPNRIRSVKIQRYYNNILQKSFDSRMILYFNYFFNINKSK